MMTFNVLQNLASLAIFSVLYLCSQIGSDQRTQYTRAGTVGNNVLGGRGVYRVSKKEWSPYNTKYGLFSIISRKSYAKNHAG